MQSLYILLSMLMGVQSRSAYPENDPFPPDFESRFTENIKNELSNFLDQNKMGSWMAIRIPNADFHVSMGTSDSVSSAKPTDVIPIGSYAKPWTAVAIMRLVEAGALSLDEPMAPWVDKALTQWNGTTLSELGWSSEINKVTIRMLLHMNSGLTSYNDSVIRKLTLDDPDYDIDPYDYLAINSRAFSSQPGSVCAYNSINFLLLGLIMAAQSGTPWDKFDQIRAALPESLVDEYRNGTSFYIHGLCSEYPMNAHYYDWLGLNHTTNKSEFQDMFDKSCLNGWAFGNIGASAVSAAKFMDDLFGHPVLLSKKSIQEMTTFGPGPVLPYETMEYGLGVWRTSQLAMKDTWMNVSFPGLEPFLSYVGHAGDDYGTVSRQGWHETLKMSFSVMINRQKGDFPQPGSDMHVVYCVFWKVLLALLNPALEKAFSCPPILNF